jgi:hypothetical protein
MNGLPNRVRLHLNAKPVPPSPPNGYGDLRTPAPKAKRAQKAKGDGRDARTGRFGKGNTAAVGQVNPIARARAELQKALVAAVSKSDMEALAQRLLADALRGQVASAELLLKYVVGKPAPAADPDRVALDGWRLLQAWPWLAEMLATTGRAVEPDLAQQFAGLAVADTLEKAAKRLEQAEDAEDQWGNLYIDKQTDALIKRRVTTGR